MHRYSVSYIARSGGDAEYIVYAHNEKEARKKAEALDLDDIKHVRRVGLSIAPFLVIGLLIAMVVFIVMHKG